jgi:hypothetical protein
MKNLENYGILELNAQEIKEINGGIFGWDDVLVGLAIAAGAAIINDWDNFKKGFWSAFK